LIGKVRLSEAGPVQLMEELKLEGWQRAYVDGGKIIQSFLREDLIEDLVLTRLPILLGEGIPLFGRIGRDIRLVHLETAAHASGFVQSRYSIPR
jgi:dihydrofolate reductase